MSSVAPVTVPARRALEEHPWVIDGVDAAELARARSELSLVPPAPREASAHARRIVHAYTGAHGGCLLFGAGCFTLSLVFALPLVAYLYVFGGDVLLWAASRPAVGVVLDHDGRAPLGADGKRPLCVRFRYDVDGAAYDAQTCSWDGARLRAAAPLGASVPVEVYRFDATRARIAGFAEAPVWLSFLPFSLPFFLALGLLWLIRRVNQAEIHAFHHGTPALARVTRGPTQNTPIKQLMWTYFVDGALHRGSVTALGSTLDAFRDRTVIVILVDEARPKRSAPWVPPEP